MNLQLKMQFLNVKDCAAQQVSFPEGFQPELPIGGRHSSDLTF